MAGKTSLELFFAFGRVIGTRQDEFDDAISASTFEIDGRTIEIAMRAECARCKSDADGQKKWPHKERELQQFYRVVVPKKCIFYYGCATRLPKAKISGAACLVPLFYSPPSNMGNKSGRMEIHRRAVSRFGN